MKKLVTFIVFALAVSTTLVAQNAPQLGNVPYKLNVVAPEPASASDEEAIAPNMFGAGNLFYDIYHNSQFRPLSPASAWQIHINSGYAWPTGGGDFLIGQLKNDVGTRMHLIRFFYEDTNAAAGPTFFLCKYTYADSTGASPFWDCTRQVAPAVADASGFTSISLSVNEIMLDQESPNEVFWTPVAYVPVTDGTIKFLAARVMWSREVSPAPVAATFLDVPTSSPIFKFVEALYAAGITGGCGGGNYCPNSPLTRGQMAVFLSQALGLAWN